MDVAKKKWETFQQFAIDGIRPGWARAARQFQQFAIAGGGDGNERRTESHSALHRSFNSSPSLGRWQHIAMKKPIALYTRFQQFAIAGVMAPSARRAGLNGVSVSTVRHRQSDNPAGIRDFKDSSLFQQFAIARAMAIANPRRHLT